MKTTNNWQFSVGFSISEFPRSSSEEFSSFSLTRKIRKHTKKTERKLSGKTTHTHTQNSCDSDFPIWEIFYIFLLFFLDLIFIFVNFNHHRLNGCYVCSHILGMPPRCGGEGETFSNPLGSFFMITKKKIN